MTSMRGKSAVVLCTAVLCTSPFKLRQYNNFLSLNTLIKVFVDVLGNNICKNQYESISSIWGQTQTMLANSALLPLSTNKITRAQWHYDVTTVMSLVYKGAQWHHCAVMNLIGAHYKQGRWSFLFVYPLVQSKPQYSVLWAVVLYYIAPCTTLLTKRVQAF